MGMWTELRRKRVITTVMQEEQYQKELQDNMTACDPNLIAKGRYNLTRNCLDYYHNQTEDAVHNTVGITYDEALLATASLAIEENKKQEILELFDRKKLIQDYHSGRGESTCEY